MSNIYHLNAVRAAAEPAPEQIEAQEGGYIKLFRSLQDCAFADRPEYFSAWVHILMLASHKPRKTMLGNKPIMLQAGQFVSGRNALADRIGVSPQTMRTILNHFESEEMISRESSRQGTVFTVVNYAVFQGEKGEKTNQQPPRQINQRSTKLKASNIKACSDSGNDQSTNDQPTQSTTTQEHNNTIPNGIVTYDSSVDESSAKSPAPQKSSTDYPKEFEWIWQNRPRRSGPDPKKKTFQACKARIKQGATWRELAEGMVRYAKHCKDSGKLNTQYVMQMATFFGPDEHYQTEDFGTDQRGTQRGTAKAPDWDSTDWANDLGGL